MFTSGLREFFVLSRCVVIQENVVIVGNLFPESVNFLFFLTKDSFALFNVEKVMFYNKHIN